MFWRSLLRRDDPPTPQHLGPEFGFRVTLRQGDRIVWRAAGGRIEVLRVTGDRTVETVTPTDEAAA